jgi:hypothetical protein
MEQYRDRPKHHCSLENNELIEICTEWIQKLIDSGGKAWVMNVPARPNSDPDLVFTELVERLKKTEEPVSVPSVAEIEPKEMAEYATKMIDTHDFIKDQPSPNMRALAYRQGFLDALQYKSRQIAGVQWVKASDNLPQEGKQVKLRIDGKLCFSEEAFGYWKSEELAFMVNGKRYPPTLYFIEWLDESGSSLSEQKSYHQLELELEDWKEECLMLRQKVHGDSLSTAKEPGLSREALRKEMEMPPYLLSKANRFNWFHYLHIKGGSGSKNGSGGQHKFYVYYATPEEEEKIGTTSPEFACEELNIPYGYGDTIQEAYTLFLQSQTKQP